MKVSKITFQTLTSYLQIAGLSPQDSKNIASLFLKWLHTCGPEWTNARWKDLRQWYETYLAGKPVPAPWFSKTRKNIPKGCLGAIFRLTPEKALLALSINTLLVAKEETPSQKLKFRKGLEGNGTVCTPKLRAEIRREFAKARPKHPPRVTFNGEIHLLDVFDLETGKTTIPISGGKSFRLKDPRDSEEEAQIRLAKAIQESWKATPEVTKEFLWDLGHLDWIPWDKLAPGGYQIDHNGFDEIVGRIGHIQEPQLKERNVASPMMVTQVTLLPLAKVWYDTLDRLGYPKDLPLILNSYARDCYRNQEAGVEWVQAQLRNGTEMAGVDLTSATDLLDLDCCLEIVNTVWFDHLRDNSEYNEFVQYFKEVSRLPFVDGQDKLTWKQGQPMGCLPSFALLGLTNNAICRLACLEAGLHGNEYCVLGDDVEIDSRAFDHYVAWITRIGGEVNHSKTLCSDKVAEFGGRIILPNQICQKATKLYNGISDDNFMQFMATVGSKGRRLLKPRQRKMWDIFRFIPGVVVPGPYSDDGFGESLALRYEWYLSHVENCKILPEQDIEVDAGFRQLKLRYLLALDSEDDSLPSPIEDLSYQLSPEKAIRSGDPRKWYLSGKTLLETLEGITREPGFLTFEEFKASKETSL